MNCCPQVIPAHEHARSSQEFVSFAELLIPKKPALIEFLRVVFREIIPVEEELRIARDDPPGSRLDKEYIFELLQPHLTPRYETCLCPRTGVPRGRGGATASAIDNSVIGGVTPAAANLEYDILLTRPAECRREG